VLDAFTDCELYRLQTTEMVLMANVTIEKVRAATAPGYPPCWEYYVYLGDKLIRVCPSIGMAQEVAAGL
jgi:hypothetical protein